MHTATPPAGLENTAQAFPSPFFSQSTPTSNFPNPFAPPVDCVLELTQLLSHPITLTLAQILPYHLVNLPASGFASSGYPGAASTAAASSASVATTNISEATSSSHAPASTSGTRQSGSSSSHGQQTTASTSAGPSATFPPNSGFVCNEQLAASSLSLPTTSIGTIWRIARGFDWLGENGPALNALASSHANPITPRPQGIPSGNSTADQPLRPTETTFEFASLVQSTLDVLASTAAEQNIELCYFHGRLQQQLAPVQPLPKAGLKGAALPDSAKSRSSDLPDLQEAYVQADERGLGIALLAVIKQVMHDARPGESVQVGLNIALTSPQRKTGSTNPSEVSQPNDASSDDSGGEGDRVSRQPRGSYLCTLEIVHTYLPASARRMSTDQVPGSPGSDEEAASQPIRNSRVLDSAVLSALLQHLRISSVTCPPTNDQQTFKVTCVLPEGEDPTGSTTKQLQLSRRRSIDQSKEPTVSLDRVEGRKVLIFQQTKELWRFVDTLLRGKKAALHAPESSAFAKQLSHHLASWGLDVNHISTLDDDDHDPAQRSKIPQYHHSQLGRFDSGFAGSEGQSPVYPNVSSPAPYAQADPFASYNQPGTSRSSGPPSEPSSAVTSPPLDPQLSFIIIDDDLPTLKRQLISVRNNAPTVQLHNALLAKRPQLQSRRTRSTQAIPRINQVSVSIIHFTSLAHYRQIKEIVSQILKNASPVFPHPEVLVVPKPIGPRRLLTTLFNAVKRPALDPSFIPIATSPSSPGGHYFFAGSKPSPAPSHTNEFDVAAGQALSANQAAQKPVEVSSLSAAYSTHTGPKTPPVFGPSGSDPPSPVSPDALEYFSKSAAELGSSASQGIIIQSPDGRPTGLFFQPRAASLYDKAESLRMSRLSADSTSSDYVQPGQKPKTSPNLVTVSMGSNTELPAIVVPDHIDIAQSGQRPFSIPTGLHRDDTASFGQRGAEALAADAASPISISSPVVRQDSDSSNEDADRRHRQGSPGSHVPQGTPRLPSEPSSPRSPQSPMIRAQAFRPPGSPTSPNARKLTPPKADERSRQESDGRPGPLSEQGIPPAQTVVSPPKIRKTSGRVERAKKLPRRPTGTLVPPINVLIVEGTIHPKAHTPSSRLTDLLHRQPYQSDHSFYLLEAKGDQV